MSGYKFNILLSALALMLCGCEVKPVNEYAVSVNPLGWNAADTAKVAYENTDTTAFKDIMVSVRTNHDFRHGILPLIVRTYAPDSTYCEESINITPGKDQYGTFTDKDTPYRLAARLPLKGIYEFRFTPAANEITGVEAVGIRILPATRNGIE